MISETDIVIWSKVYGKPVSQQAVKLHKDILGDGQEHTMDFTIFDGFAIAEQDGKEVGIIYPKLSFLTKSPAMQAAVREFIGADKDTKISVTDLLMAYGSCFEIKSPTSAPTATVTEESTEEEIKDAVNESSTIQVVNDDAAPSEKQQVQEVSCDNSDGLFD